jgi:WD40 repeat protein
MNFSKENVSGLISHKQQICSIFQFPNNDPNHFISISENSELKEWLLGKTPKRIIAKEISSCFLERPSDALLINNKHKIGNLPKNKTHLKITKILVYENTNIAIGYEDGLILIWNMKLENAPKKQIFENNDDEIELIQELNEFAEKSYINTYNLDYVFIGQTQNICEFFFYKNRNFLISSSEDYSLKIWDLNVCSL